MLAFLCLWRPSRRHHAVNTQPSMSARQPSASPRPSHPHTEPEKPRPRPEPVPAVNPNRGRYSGNLATGTYKKPQIALGPGERSCG